MWEGLVVESSSILLSRPIVALVRLIMRILILKRAVETLLWCVGHASKLYSQLAMMCATELQWRQRRGHSNTEWPAW